LVKGVRRNLQGEPDAKFCLQPKFVAGVKSLGPIRFHVLILCIRHETTAQLVIELARLVPESHLCAGSFRQTGTYAAKELNRGRQDLKVLGGSAKRRPAKYPA